VIGICIGGFNPEHDAFGRWVNHKKAKAKYSCHSGRGNPSTGVTALTRCRYVGMGVFKSQRVMADNIDRNRVREDNERSGRDKAESLVCAP
jgi:hypothetical protein